jgi:anti-sigma B factor antagonist
MELTFESHIIDKVAVIRCKGRITYGPEAEALETEINRQTKVAGTDTFKFTRVVLQMGEIDFIDSSGLGAIVRLFGVLRAAGGGLKLCQMSAKVLKVIEITHLGSLFPAWTSEAQAIEAFSTAPRSQGERTESLKTRIVCVDPSMDLLAGLNALLTRSGYEVYTTRYIGEASTLTRATRPKVLICGPGMADVPTAAATIDQLRQNADLQILQLPSDFHTSEAGQAGQDLVSQVQSLVAS